MDGGGWTCSGYASVFRGGTSLVSGSIVDIVSLRSKIVTSCPRTCVRLKKNCATEHLADGNALGSTGDGSIKSSQRPALSLRRTTLKP